MSCKKIWNTVRFHQAMCRCRASNDAGCCHSSGHKRRFLSASSSIFSYRQEFQQSSPECWLIQSLLFLWSGGHFTCACPQKTANSSQPNPASTAMIPYLPKSLCPRCQKGYHWAKDCRSRFHKNGTSLVPEKQSGNGLGSQPQAPITTGATTTTMNPFIPFVPSQSSSEQPQAEQDWT